MGKPLELARELSPLGAGAIAFGCLIGWGSFVMPGTTFLPQAGPAGTAIALAIGAIVMVVIAACFAYMTRRRPVTGGVFAFTRETFGRAHAFVCAWLLGMTYIIIVPQNATATVLAAHSLVGDALEIGPHYSLAGYNTYLGDVVAIMAIMALFGYLIIRGRNIAVILQTVFCGCILLGAAVILATAAASPSADVFHLEPAFSPAKSEVAGVLSVLAVSPWLFVGFETVSQMGGELAFDTRKVGPIMVISVALGFFVYLALNSVAASVVPAGYANWTEYVADAPNLSGMASIPVFNAVHTVLGDAGAALLGVAALGATLSGVAGFYIVSSRLLYAMARGGVVPQQFGELNPRYGTPAKAVMLIFVLSVATALLGRTVLSWLVDMSSIGAAVGFFYASAAARKIAKREGKRLIAAVGMAGMVLSVLLMVLLLVPIPGLNCNMGLESIVFLIAWAAFGVNLFTPDYSSDQHTVIDDTHLTAIDSE